MFLLVFVYEALKAVVLRRICAFFLRIQTTCDMIISV